MLLLYSLFFFKRLGLYLNLNHVLLISVQFNQTEKSIYPHYTAVDFKGYVSHGWMNIRPILQMCWQNNCICCLAFYTACTQQEYYDKGEFVIREGEEGSTFYIIAQGKVQDPPVLHQSTNPTPKVKRKLKHMPMLRNMDTYVWIFVLLVIVCVWYV